MQLAKIIIVTFHRGPQHFTLMLAKSKGKIKYHSLLANFLQKKSRKIVGIAIKTSDYAKNSLEFGEENVYLVWVLRKEWPRWFIILAGIEIFLGTFISQKKQKT